MNIIVPMAGLGSRYAEAGYTLPKPLIPVSGLPMVVRAVRDLPAADRVIFIVHQEHIDRHAIDETLRQHFPSCEVIVTPGLTEGQACTVRLAASALPQDTDVLVAACDCTHVYDANRFRQLREESDYEALIWTYRGDWRVASSPQSYGWVEVAEGSNQVTRISCKQPISATPLADHALSGFFWFRSAHGLFDAIDRLVESNERIRNEFYLDVVPNQLMMQGNPVGVFEVEKCIGWGTPQELAEYQVWEKYFNTH